MNLPYQGLLERNEMRSKALGISTNAKPPVSSPRKSEGKENKKTESIARITEMTKKSPRKSSSNEIVRVDGNKTLTPMKTRTVSSKTKEDADVAVEINITSNQNIQVRKCDSRI